MYIFEAIANGENTEGKSVSESEKEGDEALEKECFCNCHDFFDL